MEITADNSAAAQLSKDDSHKLITEYKLECDTVGTARAWSSYDCFLNKGPQVKHVAGDGAIEVTLSVRASAESIGAGDCGEYRATQTLTVCWKS
jgi:hypothetical protein